MHDLCTLVLFHDICFKILYKLFTINFGVWFSYHNLFTFTNVFNAKWSTKKYEITPARIVSKTKKNYVCRVITTNHCLRHPVSHDRYVGTCENECDDVDLLLSALFPVITLVYFCSSSPMLNMGLIETIYLLDLIIMYILIIDFIFILSLQNGCFAFTA